MRTLDVMKYLASFYKSASFVATLWCISLLLPLLLLANDEISWMPIIAVVLIIVYGTTISLFRRDQLFEGTWCMSDVVAYILVPICLFAFVTYMMLSSLNT
ncbi:MULTISPECIES: hypothetical protein [unclassified Pseudoalteromonas]|nr:MULTISPECIES: hypothetical protein [unclassified Pseudoalteromonas]ALQ08422.1 hypothetical protein D172_010330 [Pseudoalteromonas sp. Bsw20308]KDC55294.1 hypothetical protein DO88_04500 [Pseudoalteromonas sp. S3431]